MLQEISRISILMAADLCSRLTREDNHPSGQHCGFIGVIGNKFMVVSVAI